MPWKKISLIFLCFIQVQRDLSTGEILRFEEVSVQNPGVDVYSKSLHGPRVESIAGTQLVNSSFWGDDVLDLKLPDSVQKILQEEEGINITYFYFEFFLIWILFKDLLVVPPRFSRGLIFESDGCTVKRDVTELDRGWKLSAGENKKTIDLKLLIEQEQSSLCK